MPKRFQDWLNQAQYDLEHARKSLGLTDYNWACFAAQQSAEKAIKGLYDYLGGEGWGHVIVKLLRELPQDKAAVGQEMLDKAVYLDRLYIPTRYPNGVASGAPLDYYTKKDAEEAIRYAQDFLSFVKTRIH